MTLLISLHIGLCLFLITVILLQAGKGDMGIGFGSSSQSIFGSKGAGNFLTKTTSFVAAAFLFTSFLITKLRLDEQRGMQIDDEAGIEEVTTGGTDKAPPANNQPGKSSTPADSNTK